MFEIRTDLAVEERESVPGDGGEIRGVALREWMRPNSRMKLTEVTIKDEEGAKAMGKPMGSYMTLEAKNLKYPDEDYHREVSEELAGQLKHMVEELKERGHLPKKRPLHLVVVGLGNALVTPDALGPQVLEHLRVNRTIQSCFKRKGDDLTVISGIAPGVMAQTGMETAEIMKGIIREIKPDLMLAVDALAARSIRRLGTTIQLTNTGIHPGSGVGNHRHSLTEDSLGIPVLAIGVPTVVSAAAIVHDTIAALVETLNSHMETRGMGDYLDRLAPDEQYQLICELLEPEFGSLYVTPPDIDQTIRRLSYTISEGIHLAFYENGQDER